MLGCTTAFVGRPVVTRSVVVRESVHSATRSLQQIDRQGSFVERADECRTAMADRRLDSLSVTANGFHGRRRRRVAAPRNARINVLQSVDRREGLCARIRVSFASLQSWLEAVL